MEIAEISKRTDWDQMRKEVSALIRRLQQKPESQRFPHLLEPRSILNAYREGDLTFSEAVTELEKWKQGSP